jgi:hypothetical protein
MAAPTGRTPLKTDPLLRDLCPQRGEVTFHAWPGAGDTKGERFSSPVPLDTLLRGATVPYQIGLAPQRGTPVTDQAVEDGSVVVEKSRGRSGAGMGRQGMTFATEGRGIGKVRLPGFPMEGGTRRHLLLHLEEGIQEGLPVAVAGLRQGGRKGQYRKG